MDEKQVERVEITVAKLEERVQAMRENDEKINQKLDLVLAQIIKTDSNREADLVSLKISLKNKITRAIESLEEYHNKDLKEVKEKQVTQEKALNCVAIHQKKTNWVKFPYMYPKATFFLCIGFIVSLSSPIYLVLKYRNEIKVIIDTFTL